jgi:hypothetical protein
MKPLVPARGVSAALSTTRRIDPAAETNQLNHNISSVGCTDLSCSRALGETQEHGRIVSDNGAGERVIEYMSVVYRYDRRIDQVLDDGVSFRWQVAQTYDRVSHETLFERVLNRDRP